MSDRLGLYDLYVH